MKTKNQFVIAVLWAATLNVQAGWTPPESSVTPPAVVTLDAFAPPDWDGYYPNMPLVAGPDGALYGSTWVGGASGYGTLFRLETNGTFTEIHVFNGTDGNYPYAPLVAGPDGALYGSTVVGGTYNHGTLFRLETNGTFTKLHDFNGTDGDGPYRAALVVGLDGALYGSTLNGGTGFNPFSDLRYGTLFRLGTNGTFTKLHDFNGADGAYPQAALVVGPDGALYGTTAGGGANGYGTLFRVETNGNFTPIIEFNGTNGNVPSGPLVVGPDGALYGSTLEGGANSGAYLGTAGYGTLFRLEINGTFAKLHDFNGDNGFDPGPLVAGPDGALYGSTAYGGVGFAPDSTNWGSGTLFRVETSGNFTTLHEFNGTNGYSPFAALVAGVDGALYGSTYYGGSSFVSSPNNLGKGTLFRVETTGVFTTLHDFNGTDGYGPQAALAVGPDGALYGPTVYGGDTGNSGYGYGTLFQLKTNGVFTKLHEFHSSNGHNPQAALVAGPDGALYGSAFSGGINYKGTLFRVEISGTLTKLHDFNGTDGSGSSAALVAGPDGALYGSTVQGGTNGGNGTLFRLETNGIFSKLHDFNGTDGFYPTAALVAGPDGALYGSTLEGGANSDPYFGTAGYGTLFRLEINGDFTKLHDFNGIDGYGPQALLVTGPDGALYGSTPNGGTGFDPALDLVYGTLFRLETNGTFTVLHNFNGTDGAVPLAALVVGPDGALYGSTTSGGTNGGYGTLFRVEINGVFTTLHDFNGTDGYNPQAALAVGPDGALYGSTTSGGTNGDYGTLFRLETNGTFTTLHVFNGTNGIYPWSAALIAGPDGALYGSTYYGGTGFGYSYGYGTLFRLETNGTFTKLYDFNDTNGANPSVPLVAGTDGALYGLTPNGGPRGGGILFKLVLNRAPVAQCHDVAVSPGTDCTANASIDNGSFDPDGDAFVLSLNPPGPYGLGSTPVTLTIVDSHGASNSCSATVTVNDTTPPGVTCPDNISTNIPSGQTSAVVNYTQPTASDNCGGVTVNCAPPSGSSFPLGVTTVNCTATDTSGNTNTCSFTVTVTASKLDSDGDGVPDERDLCPDSAPGAVVDAHGCSIAQLVPCDGPRSGGTWKNHGQYVGAVIRVATDFLRAKVITRRQWVQIVTRAARSRCGWNHRCDFDWNWDHNWNWGRD